jgi:hypothetical protein
MNDDEVMLTALSKEREQLHEQLMQVDRIIKKIKNGEYLGYSNAMVLQIQPKEQTVAQRIAFPKRTDTKVLILKAFDNLGQLCSLKQITTQYTTISGINNPSIRETVRTLNKAGLILLMKEKKADRGAFWAKREWIENGQLLEQYKPEGFDVLYPSDTIEFK